LQGTIQLTLVQLEAQRGGGSEKIYGIPVAGYPHPVFIRGGRSSDATVLYQIFCVKEYEPVTTLSSVSFILDAGANVGLASLFFLRRFPGAKILAVEPDPGNFKICEMNLERYRDRVILHLGAVWSSCCRLALVPCETEWGLAVRAAKPGEEAPIEAFDIPSLLAIAGQKSVDLLKLDIEGSEAELFSSGAPQWLGAIRNIIVEFHGVECERRFLDAMQDFQYRRLQRPMVEFFTDIHPREQFPMEQRPSSNVR
jgi:FkbM family methyltransferase